MSDDYFTRKHPHPTEQLALRLYTDAEKGYLAGLFDGEGYIQINNVQKRAYRNHEAYGRKYTTYRLHVRISLTTPHILEWLVQKVGGTIYDHKRANGGNRKPSWTWHLGGKACLPFLKLIEPYCMIKHKHIALAVRFLAFGSAFCPEERFALSEEMHVLNMRGIGLSDSGTTCT